MIGVLALSPAVDVTYEVDALVPGEITRPVRTTTVAGGKSLNMARVAVALGAEVSVTVVLGGSNGRRVSELLRADGVAMTEVGIAAETRTCLAIVESGGGASSTDVYEAAAAVTPGEWSRFADAVRSAPTGAWTTLSGSLPAGVPVDGLARLLDGLRAEGSRLAFDVAAPAITRLLRREDLVKVNRAEASALLGVHAPDADTACTLLHTRFGVDAVVTDGIRGSAALIDGMLHRVGPPRVQGRFPAGSGDAFFGGLVHGLDRGDDVADALQTAREAAERNAQVPGQGVLGG